MSRADRTAVVVVTWNKQARLRDCLRSLRALPGGDFDVLVVDNASTDGTAEMVRREFPEVELLVNDENLGGAGGFNRGMQHAVDAGYGFIWLLDDDVAAVAAYTTKPGGFVQAAVAAYTTKPGGFVQAAEAAYTTKPGGFVKAPGALRALQRVMAERPDCGVAGSKIYAAGTGLEFIQELGSFIDWDSAGIRLNRNGVFDHGRIAETVEVDYVPACSMLVRVAALEGQALFDPSYFLYWDDIDFCHRITLAGWKVLACGESVVHHFSSGERAGTSLTIYYSLRNSLYFVRRYQADPEALRACARRRLSRAAERAGLFVTLGRDELTGTMERAVRDGLAMVRGRVDDLAVEPLAAHAPSRLGPARTLVLVAQRPHIFSQCRPAVEQMLGHGETTYLVNEQHLPDLRAMDTSNVRGHREPQFHAESVEMERYAGGYERVVLLGKDALFANAVEAALALGARETFFADFYGNVIELTDRTLDEQREHTDAFRVRWVANLERSELLGTPGVPSGGGAR